MRSTIKYLLLIFTCLLGLSFIQTNIQDDIQTKLATYYENNMPLQIHLFLNQPIYAPGDTIFFSGNLLTSHELRPIGGRQIIHVHLINESGEESLKIKALAKDGRFHNQFVLPPDLQAGIYTLVAYNNWMRNQGESNYFKQAIKVVKDFKLEKVNNESPWHFYPEGGKLLVDIASKVVVKGKPNTAANIRNTNQEIVSSILTDENGYASFFLKEGRNEKYHLDVQGENSSFPIPAAVSEGIAVQLLSGKERVDVILQVPDKSLISKENLLLVISSHADLVYSTELQFQKQNSRVIRLAKNDLPEGIIQVTLFNEKKEVISERLFYHVEDPALVKIKLSKPEYFTREKVNLDVQIRDHNNESIPGEFSITVFKKDLTEGSDYNNSAHALYMHSNLYNPIRNSLKTPEQIDNYLITQKWQRFNWNDVWANKIYNTQLFKSYLDLSGEITELGTSNPKYDSLLVSCYLQGSQDIYEVYADKNGKFNASLLFDVYGHDEVYISAFRKPHTYRNVKLKSKSEETTDIIPATSKQSKIFDAYASLAQKRKNINTSYYFNEQVSALNQMGSLKTLDKIEQAIKTYDFVANFSDYYIFPSMEETIREIIPWLQHRRVNQKETVKLYIKDLDKSGEDEPLFIIDGIMTNRTDYFLSMKPADVISIKLINTLDKLEYFGVMGYNGVVVVETKIPQHGIQVARGENIINIQGLNAPLAFTSIDHEQKRNSRIPDLRANLFWSPGIFTNEKGEAGISFYTSDDTGSYLIIVQGLSKDGRPFYAESSFTVSHSPD
jgi:hypothetical protein